MALLRAEVAPALLDAGVWAAAPPRPALAPGEVHVWRAGLDATRGRLAGLRRTLSADELARAARYRAPQDRDRFVAARGTLRAILGRYLGLAPAELLFRYPCACGRPGCAIERRKPILDAACGDETITFSVSHADGLALYAIGRDRPVGVDLERVRADLSPIDLAGGVLTPRERAALAGLSAGRQQRAFFRLWTAKEAYLKARGLGFSLPPECVEVALKGTAGLALRSVDGDEAEAARWTLRALAPAPGYTGALAVRGWVSEVRLWAVT
jgi:4'-phosphopantetheinyl transferase